MFHMSHVSSCLRYDGEALRRPRRGAPLAASVLFGLALSLCAGADPAPITLTNYADGTAIRYPVPLLRGTLLDSALTEVTVVNTSVPEPGEGVRGQAYKGRFVALSELIPGENRLVINAGDASLPVTLHYKPHTSPWVVRLFYLVGSDGKTDYQTPLSDDTQDWQGKLATAGRLMQTFTAERLYDLGYGRKTFNLETGENGNVIVHLLRAPQEREHYYGKSGLDMWNLSNRLVGNQYPLPRSKNLVVCSFTWFDPETRKTHCHAALGGGDLAYFGGANLFAWPDSIADAHRAFSDATRVDTARFFSDSVGRHTFWAIASTTIGACLHELGHTFDLPHTRYPHDIMTRGIDRLNRAFTLVEPPHAGRKTTYDFRIDEIAEWSAPSADALVTTLPFQADLAENRPANCTTLRLDTGTRSVRISSPNGIRFVGVHAKGDCLYHAPIAPGTPGPTTVELPISEMAEKAKTDKVRIRAVDEAGHSSWIGMDELLRGPFVSGWRLSEVSTEWRKTDSFPEVDDAKLAEVVAGAADGAVTGPGNRVNLLDHFSPEQQTNRAAYLVKEIQCDAVRSVKILTGSDDALRLWLNGKLVQQVLALRAVRVDSESVDVELARGRNTLVAEVCQGTGGWELVLRLETLDGKPVAVADDGQLDVMVSSPEEIRQELCGPWLRSWRFAPDVYPWPTHGAFRDVSDEELATIETTAKSAKPIESDLPMVDFLPRFSGHKTNNVVAYALRVIHCDEETPIRILTGSDDALRMWLNGKLVKEVLALRGVQADSDSTDVMFQPGENRLLVEVSQVGGGWGLIMRLATPDGDDLVLGDDDRLTRHRK